MVQAIHAMRNDLRFGEDMELGVVVTFRGPDAGRS
jgi:hypothetical protein